MVEYKKAVEKVDALIKLKEDINRIEYDIYVLNEDYHGPKGRKRPGISIDGLPIYLTDGEAWRVESLRNVIKEFLIKSLTERLAQLKEQLTAIL